MVLGLLQLFSYQKVVAKDTAARQAEAQLGAQHYFYGYTQENPINPFSIDVPMAKLNLFKIGGA